jgi:hypothetical protein
MKKPFQKAPEYFDRCKQTFDLIVVSPCNPITWEAYRSGLTGQLKEMEDFVKGLESVTVELVEQSGYGDDPYSQLEVTGIKPWSEAKIRKHKEKQAIEEQKKRQEEEDFEMEEYLRLQKKFGNAIPGQRQRS